MRARQRMVTMVGAVAGVFLLSMAMAGCDGGGSVTAASDELADVSGNADLQASIDELVAQKEAERSARDEEIQALEDQIQELKELAEGGTVTEADELAALREQIEKLKAEAKEAEAEAAKAAAEAKEELEAAQKEAEEAQDAANDAQSEAKSLQDELDDAQSEVKSLQNELDNSKGEGDGSSLITVTLYWDAHYLGSPLLLSENVPHLSEFGFNDAAGSLKIEKGGGWDDSSVCLVLLFQDADYKGKHHTWKFTGKTIAVTSLEDAWRDDSASSVQINCYNDKK